MVGAPGGRLRGRPGPGRGLRGPGDRLHPAGLRPGPGPPQPPAPAGAATWSPCSTSRSGIHAAYDHQLRALYGDQVFAATVPLAKDFKEAVAARQPVAAVQAQVGRGQGDQGGRRRADRAGRGGRGPAGGVPLPGPPGRAQGPGDRAATSTAVRGGGPMSKAAESLQRRFGSEPQREPGRPRRDARRRGRFAGGRVSPGNRAPTTAGPAPATPGTWRSTGSSPTPTSPARSSADDAIDRLAASLLKHGQLHADPGPLERRRSASGWSSRASAATGPRSGPGLKTVACVFADDGLSPSEILQEQIIENLPPRGPQADRAGPRLPPADGPPRLDGQGTLRASCTSARPQSRRP